MLNNQPFATKLQLIFLPLIITPVILLILILLLIIPGRLIEAQEELLRLKLDQAYQMLEEGYELLVTAGIEDDLFFRQTRQNRIVSGIREISVEDAQFALYSRRTGGFLIEPDAPETFLAIIPAHDMSHLYDPGGLHELADSRVGIRYLVRSFGPWEMIIGLQIRIADLYRPIINLVMLFAVPGIAIIIIAALLIRRISWSLSSPISELVDTVGEFGAGDFHRRIEPRGKDEIARLSVSFNTMADRISDFARELERKVEERTLALQQNIEMLQQTQHQLIESEKLASLGSVVSGVAHEINTPLGVGITSASFLEHQLNRMESQYRTDSLTKSELEDIISKSRESLGILLENLNRAQILVQSFKEVSADQLVDEQRTFNFREYVNEILSSLQNQIKRNIRDIRVEGPESLYIYSHPGAYWQIFSNLIQNSIVHAFPDGFKGKSAITISYESDDGGLNIVFADNGVGMEDRIRRSAFEPFVTTRRGQGGTGLGLNIVFNIVQRLNGVISLESGPSGTSVFITIPDIIRETNQGEQPH
jgi:signal transduction histidine kinase